MPARTLFFRSFVIVAGGSLVASLFLPIFFWFFLVGPQGGEQSLLQGSPLIALCLAAGTGAAVGISLANQPQKQRRILLVAGMALGGASLLGFLISLRIIPGLEFPVGVGLHPLGLAAVFAGGMACIGAAALAQRGQGL
jgi:hypothetical protein